MTLLDKWLTRDLVTLEWGSRLGLILVATACGLGCAAKDPNDTSVNGSGASLDPSDSFESLGGSDAVPLLASQRSADVPRPFECKGSEATMFEGHEALNLRIAADFTRLNADASSQELAELKKLELDATVDFLDQSGNESGALPLHSKIMIRGVSRAEHCAFRPFALKRLKDINEQENPGYLKRTVFGRLGNSVKFVTHCGSRTGDPDPKYRADVAVHEQRVRMEHTVYQMLDQLELPSLKTRLIKLTYRDTHDPEHPKDEVHIAFVREPEDQMAKRCGMLEQEDAQDAWPSVANPHSELLFELMNAFVIQNDVSVDHNTINLTDKATHSELFYAPYDFDLVGIYRPDFPGNGGRSLAGNAENFAVWLRRNQSPTLFSEVARFRAVSDGMSSVIDRSGMEEANARIFRDWLTRYQEVLRGFSSCEGLADDPSRPECYVHDDHPGSDLATAESIDGQSWSTVLEPPGDVDVFETRVEPGTLHSFGGGAAIQLLDAQGNVLAESEGERFGSTTKVLPDTVYVRASSGKELISVPMRVVISSKTAPVNRSLFFYADDHGGTLETATPLTVNQRAAGEFEVQGGLDEDWFRVFTSDPTTVAVTAQDRTELVVVVAKADAIDQAIIAWDLASEENDYRTTTALEPGDYIVKVMQQWGSTTSYSAELLSAGP